MVCSSVRVWCIWGRYLWLVGVRFRLWVLCVSSFLVRWFFRLVSCLVMVLVVRVSFCVVVLKLFRWV